MKVTIRGAVLDFEGARRSTVLDRSAAAGTSLELVDAIVEREDGYIFVVVEMTPKGARPQPSSELCERLARAYRDTFFFYSFSGHETKRIEYAVLVATSGADTALIYAMQDELRRRIPIAHPGWQRDSAWECSMLTPRQWEKRFGPVELPSTEQQ